MLGYMEVILGRMLASQPCLHAFWVLASLHILSFLLKMFFIILVYIYIYTYLFLIVVIIAQTILKEAGESKSELQKQWGTHLIKVN